MARVPRRLHLAFYAAVTESSRHHNARDAHQGRRVAGVDLLGRNPTDVDAEVVVDARMLQGFENAEVRVGQRDVLADDRDWHLRARMLDPIDELCPLRVVRNVRRLLELEVLGHHLAQAGGFEHERDFVDRFHVRHRDDCLSRHVGEQRDLLLQVVVDR